MEEKRTVEVSIIVPAYNCERWLKETLTCLCGQDFDSYEIIVVDDGSTDATAEIAASFAAACPKLRCLRQQNSGAAAARNAGLESAQGRYCLFVDADDLFAPDLISRLYGAAQAGNADIAICDTVAIDSATLSPLHPIPGHAGLSEGMYTVDDALRQRLFQIFGAHPWDKLIRTDLIRRYGLRFQTLHHSNDTLFVLSALALARRISVVDEALVRYRKGTASSTRDGTVKAPLCDLIAHDALRSDLRRLGVLDEALTRSLDNLCLDVVVRNTTSLAAVSLDAVRAFQSAYLGEYESKWGLKGVSCPYIYSRSRCLSYGFMRRLTPEGLSWACQIDRNPRITGGRSRYEKALLGARLALAAAPLSPYRRRTKDD